MKPRLILVSGFLGSGKTTLLKAATDVLRQRGVRVGIITNDQAPDLVDTAFLYEENQQIQEIAGGCFCCNFQDLNKAVETLTRKYGTEVILAEAVGSCTDIAATVAEPYRRYHPDAVRVAPLSVVIDPFRVRDLLNTEADQDFAFSVRYLFQKQIEEADLLLLNKADLVDPAEFQSLKSFVRKQIGDTPVLGISALEGTGISNWLAVVESEDRGSGEAMELDYDLYAEGEAALGWLNANVNLSGSPGQSWKSLVKQFLTEMQANIRERGMQIAHVKVLMKSAGHGAVVGNLTGNDDDPSLTGMILRDPESVTFIVNARVQGAADTLRSLTEESLHTLTTDGLQFSVNTLESFHPARPEPTYRVQDNHPD